VTQNWGPPNSNQQWPGNPGWNRQPNGWAAPPAPYQSPQQPTPASQYAQFLGTAPQAPAYPPGYAQPSGIPGSFPTPPTRRKSPLLAVLGGAAFVLILGFFLIALTNYLSGGSGGGGGDDPTYHQVNNVPAPDYDPPALPIPKTYDQATNWLVKNAIYQQSVPVPTNCTVPELDASTASATELESHLNTLTACLWGVWEGPTTAAGFELPRPPTTVYSTTITTPCGKTETGNAFYCAADQHIYYATDLPRILPASIRHKSFITEAIMAHEFGHAIQARTGILIADNAWEQKSSKADARVFSRRTEVQADCMAGLWVNAISKASNVTASDEANLKFLFYNIGDDMLTGEADYDGDHGLGKNRQTWFTTGLTNSDIGKCNTYVAPSSQVR
jgi:uncharacterized protein